jgi:hypothetical protein
VASRIEEQFPGSYEEYSVEEFVHFIVDTNIGQSSFIFIEIIAYLALKAA